MKLVEYVNSVLGKTPVCELGVTLAHEHIGCYCEYLYKMAGKDYIDKEELETAAVSMLCDLNLNYGVSTFIDCTPLNTGRDAELLKRISEKSGVNIICSGGFYYTEDIIYCNTSVEDFKKFFLKDAITSNAGIIKFAVEEQKMTELNKRMLTALCEVQKELSLPLCVHTNARHQNGLEVLEFILSKGVAPQWVTIGHCSDCEDLEYITQIAESGCYIGMDRIYPAREREFYKDKAKMIYNLIKRGYGEKLLLSHDALIFNCFAKVPSIQKKQTFSDIFTNLIPELKALGVSDAKLHTLLVDNPKNMLIGK